jgi:beta-glucanase (GH16 family)
VAQSNTKEINGIKMFMNRKSLNITTKPIIMISLKRIKTVTAFILIVLLTVYCTSNQSNKKNQDAAGKADSGSITVQAKDFVNSKYNEAVIFKEKKTEFIKVNARGWLEYKVQVPETGRYRVRVSGSSSDSSQVACWIEDNVYNKDGRTYNITGNMMLRKTMAVNPGSMVEKDGTPLVSGPHIMRLHYDTGTVVFEKICFDLIRKHKSSPVVLTQKTSGKEWKLVWSDEFNGTGLPDTSKWTFDIGNWGWGNNELQYYTVNRLENARQEDGSLIIEARKDDGVYPWSSARLTTRGKESFLYGKIEFRGKVPAERGTWSAGWLLGDEYKDELSWPYCGEIDVLESVGFEMDPKTGNGITHASVHCGAYYFKLGNQPTAILDVNNLTDEYHIYSIEWLSGSISILIDGRKYFEYHDTSNDLTWPFSKPQNLILNLAIGGGWGGAKGVDPDMKSAKFILDYVRVYELN